MQSKKLYIKNICQDLKFKELEKIFFNPNNLWQKNKIKRIKKHTKHGRY